MKIQQDCRSIVRPRSSIARLEQRLIEAGEHATPLTLSLRDVGVLLTFIAAAKRIAETVATQKPSAQYANAEIRLLTRAWEAAERRVLELEQRVGDQPEPTS